MFEINLELKHNEKLRFKGIIYYRNSKKYTLLSQIDTYGIYFRLIKHFIKTLKFNQSTSGQLSISDQEYQNVSEEDATIYTLEYQKKEIDDNSFKFTSIYNHMKLIAHAKGFRKKAVAQTMICEDGDKTLYINGKPFLEWAKKHEILKLELENFLKELDERFGLFDKFTIFCIVKGGGFASQHFAVLNGISKAIAMIDVDYKKIVKSTSVNYFTNDTRVKERKKPGRKKARKNSPKPKR